MEKLYLEFAGWILTMGTVNVVHFEIWVYEWADYKFVNLDTNLIEFFSFKSIYFVMKSFSIFVTEYLLLF